MRKLCVAVLAALSLLSLAACGSGAGSASGSGEGDYVIGYVNGMSGPVAVYGQYTLSYLQAAVKSANASGGINGRQVKIDVIDSAAVGQNPVSATLQMIAKYKPEVIYGFTVSQDCAAAASVAAKREVPLICATIPESLVNPVQKYAFGSLALEPAMAKPAVDFAVNDLELKSGTTYATVINDGAGNIEFAKTIDSLAPAAGLKKVTGQVIPLTAASPATQISNVVAKRPGVIFIEVGPQLSTLVQGIRAAGVKAPIIAILSSLGYDGLLKLADPGFYEVTQSAFVTRQTAAASAGIAKVEKILTAAGMSGPVKQNQRLGSMGILPALGILQAFGTCGKACTPPKMATALESVTVTLDGFVKDYRWTAQDHMPVNYVGIASYDPATKGVKTDATDLPVGSSSGQ